MIKHRGVSYEYNPPKVVYPGSTTSNAIKEQARFLTLADRERTENRQRSMLMRALQTVGSTLDIPNHSDHAAFS